ncbi:uncharacterized protein LOC132066438 [Lycium ferocissimum]|uniref:uncharacterized protein LOC132066438 n=1 Tax=Lycium ferocissimum TaxID=112874 RepID=UPI0028159726|nr:uncharacterized protein LOC132066438 [Lycium ferocissimum]
MDATTKGRTRPSMAKVRIEIDLTKPRLNKIWVGLRNAVIPLQGFEQKIEYKGVPKYCNYCRLQGHYMNQCRRMEKDKVEREDFDKNNQEKNKNNRDQEANATKGTNLFKDSNGAKSAEISKTVNVNQVITMLKDNVETGGAKRTMEATTSKGTVVTKNSAKEVVSQSQRGRQVQAQKETRFNNKRGTSAPPKKSFKPTGAIFGVDKPPPTNEMVKSGETEKKKMDDITIESNTTNTANNPQTYDKDLEHQQQLMAKGTQMVATPIKDPNELHIMFIELGNEGDKDTEAQETNEPDKQDPTQNKKPHEDEWAGNTSTEYDDSSDGSSDEEVQNLIDTTIGKDKDTEEQQKVVAKVCKKQGLSPRAVKKKKKVGESSGKPNTQAQKMS